MAERSFRLLLVCTGNTCRSPMAEALLRDLLRREPLPMAIEISSAGTAAFVNDPAAAAAVQALAERSIDLSAHRARSLSAPLLQGVDLVLTMTQRQKEAVLELAPELRGRAFTLGEAAAGALRGEAVAAAADVLDPYGSDLDSYRATAAQIEELLRRVLADLPGWVSRGGDTAPPPAADAPSQ